MRVIPYARRGKKILYKPLPDGASEANLSSLSETSTSMWRAFSRCFSRAEPTVEIPLVVAQPVTAEQQTVVPPATGAQAQPQQAPAPAAVPVPPPQAPPAVAAAVQPPQAPPAGAAQALRPKARLPKKLKTVFQRPSQTPIISAPDTGAPAQPGIEEQAVREATAPALAGAEAVAARIEQPHKAAGTAQEVPKVIGGEDLRIGSSRLGRGAGTRGRRRASRSPSVPSEEEERRSFDDYFREGDESDISESDEEAELREIEVDAFMGAKAGTKKDRREVLETKVRRYREAMDAAYNIHVDREGRRVVWRYGTRKERAALRGTYYGAAEERDERDERVATRGLRAEEAERRRRNRERERSRIYHAQRIESDTMLFCAEQASQSVERGRRIEADIYAEVERVAQPE